MALGASRRSTECITPPRAGDPAGPKDCALEVFGEMVIVRRWQRFTDKSANLENDGRHFDAVAVVSGRAVARKAPL